MDILGDRFLIGIRGDRLCGGSVHILGDRFLIEVWGAYSWKCGYFRRSLYY
jgi:hypothetical protein